jgi:hypothetical protein
MSTTVIGYIRPRSVYEAGFSGTVTVPDGAISLAAWVQGAGGAGRQYYDPFTALDWDDGGGGGAFSFFESEVLEAEWGTSLTLSVGSAVADANGQPSTIAGTLNGASVSVVAGGGPKTFGGIATASGGTTNIDGGFGEIANPGDGTPGTAGLPGGDGQDLVEPGGTGGLGVTLAEGGYIVLEWS